MSIFSIFFFLSVNISVAPIGDFGGIWCFDAPRPFYAIFCDLKKWICREMHFLWNWSVHEIWGDWFDLLILGSYPGQIYDFLWYYNFIFSFLVLCSFYRIGKLVQWSLYFKRLFISVYVILKIFDIEASHGFKRNV